MLKTWRHCETKSVLLYENIPVLLAALKACSISRDLETGRKIHSFTNQVTNVYVSNTLIDMYAKCGSMADACSVFDSMTSPDLVSWNVLIQGYAVNGEETLALELFSRMASRGCEPDSRSFVAALVACSSQATKENGYKSRDWCLDRGRDIHFQAQESGSASNIFVASALVDMYAKCGSIREASLVFGTMKVRNVVSWTSLLLGYVEQGEAEQALDLFQQMQLCCLPNSRTFVAAIMACASLGGRSDGKFEWLDRGTLIHSQAVKLGFGSDIFVASALIDMYSKCGSLSRAVDVFESVQHPDVIVWNAMMQGYVENRNSELALDLFDGMEKPDARSYVTALMACSSLAAAEESTLVNGKLVKAKSLSRGVGLHSVAARDSFDSDKFVASSLVDMYTTCGSLALAREVFDRFSHPDVVLWNAMLLGYVQNSENDEALRLFSRLPGPDSRSFIAALMACASSAETDHEDGQEVVEEFVKLRHLDEGMAIHFGARETGCDADVFVASALVEMYSKCGSSLDARAVFDRMSHRDVVVWTALISGYAANGDGETALNLLSLMHSQGCEPNSRTLVAALVACSSLASLDAGKELHAEICRVGLETGSYVASSLVDLYGKCANLDAAERIFASLSRSELAVTSWSSLMASHGRNGDTAKVMELFQSMQREGVRGDRVTFVVLLTSCSHAGLVETGKSLFRDMPRRYGVEPDLEHFHCVVDLLGRANLLEEAIEFVRRMPLKASVVTWKTVLAGCAKWKNVEIGRAAFDRAVEVDPAHEASYILMANLYGSVRMWEEQLRILELKEARCRHSAYRV